MIQVTFYKFHGTGNDFIMIDNREYRIRPSADLAATWCHRRFGIGADGLILLENDKLYDFNMEYYNADGNPGSMCGNGGRCVTAFAEMLGIIKGKTSFNATDGQHEATVHKLTDRTWEVALGMQSVTGCTQLSANDFQLDTGSPHYVRSSNSINSIDVVSDGKEIRYSDAYREQGINVNFISETEDNISIRTYERGVEDETLSCGTGSVAAAITSCVKYKDGDYKKKLVTRGGDLNISLNKKGDLYSNIILHGSAEYVYKGVINYSGA